MQLRLPLSVPLSLSQSLRFSLNPERSHLSCPGISRSFSISPHTYSHFQSHFYSHSNPRPFSPHTQSARRQSHTMGHSKACCTIPPVVASKVYTTKGVYETIDGIKTYVTGPSDATTGILLIMDIFGFFPQTLQGADILALSGPQHYRLFMPDFFDGEPAPIEWYPPTDATRDKLGDWFQRKGNFLIGKDKVLQYLETFKKHNPQITSWVAVGYCWGGKVVTLTSGPSTPWAASVQCHPAFVSADDAKAISIPHVLLASKDEDAAEIKSFEENLKGEKLVDTFDTQIHGWMAARADLEDPAVLKEYERGYRVVLDFLGKHL